jgi:succinyl-CoA synthetase beta subunit
MKIHEYQARALLANAGVPVPSGLMVQTAEEAVAETKRLLAAGAGLIVIKAQVHAGGRGKAGFVKLVRSVEEAEEAAMFMLTNRMVSPQTGTEGLAVDRLLVADGVDIDSEFYLAITLDRTRGTAALIASAEGGVEIERVAEETPEKIFTEPIDPRAGLAAWQARSVAFRLGFRGKQVGQAVKIMMALSTLFTDTDASLVEINPLVLTPADDEHPDGRVLAIDAKFSFDDNALFRHPELRELDDDFDSASAERRAEAAGLSYVALDGNIGCLVNGAGLAMSTMDIIKLHGGEPANFLDVGGSADENAVREAFEIILSDKKVQGVLVNIFGGIMQCDTIARAIVNAAQTVGFEVPLVVRLEGTNVEEARVLLADAQANLPTMQTANDLSEAANLVCAAVTVAS